MNLVVGGLFVYGGLEKMQQEVARSKEIKRSRENWQNALKVAKIWLSCFGNICLAATMLVAGGYTLFFGAKLGTVTALSKGLVSPVVLLGFFTLSLGHLSGKVATMDLESWLQSVGWNRDLVE